MRNARQLSIAALLLLIVLGLYAAFNWKNPPGDPSEADALSSMDGPAAGSAQQDAAPFSIVSAAVAELDGRPALALSFSHPLDKKLSHDTLVHVFKMPPAAGKDKKTRNEYDEENWPSPSGVVSTSAEDTGLKDGTQVKGAWVVGENPRVLYFPHIDPNTRYVVQVEKALTSKGGARLDEEARYSVTTPEVAPAFYFASRGMVLPARENGGLPVVTVNVPEVDVQFLRVRPDQMPRFIDSMLPGKRTTRQTDDEDGEGGEYEEGYYDYYATNLQGAVYSGSLDRLHQMADSVYQGRFLTEKKPNKRSVTYLPVESIGALKEPGVYIAVMSQPGRFREMYQTTYYYVSDLGLHLRLFGQGAEAFVSSLANGDGVSGVEIVWLDKDGKELARNETNAEGRASFATKPKDAALVIARKNRQMSMILARETALDLSEFDITGLNYRPVRLFAWSGRDLYRPGESFALSVLARDDDGRPVPPQPVTATLRRADGKTQFVSTWQPVADQPGYYQQKITLPNDAPTGGWTLELRNDPSAKQAAATMRFNVEEFLPERMKLDLEAPSPAAIEPGKPLHVKVTGKYLYGAPADGNRLLGVAEIYQNTNPLAARFPGFVFGDVADEKLRQRFQLEEKTLDDEGRATLEVPTDQAANAKSPVTVRTTFSLLESGGRPVVRNIERTIWPAPVLTAVRPLFTGSYAQTNSPADFEVIRVDADGRLKEGKGLQVRLFRENRDYYWRYDDQRGWNSGYTETDELEHTAVLDIPQAGRARLRVPVRYGRYRLEIFDVATGQTQRHRFYAGWYNDNQEEQRPDRVTLKFDRDAYREGETAKLTITSPHAGVALITVDGERTLWTKRVKMDDATGTVEIPVDKAWKRHDLYVSVMVLRPGNKGDNVTPTRALGLIHLPLARGDRRLDVTIEAPERVRPESTVKVKVKVPAAKGQKVLLTLSAVDVGILNITNFKAPDPHEFFFGKLRYSADLHDIYGRLIEKMSGKRGRLKWGGDGVISAPKTTQELPKKVKLVDLFSEPVALDENGEATVPLTLPDFNGTLRLAAVVADADRFGSQNKEMTVAAPVIAELSTPRYLNFHDRSTFALDVQNLTEKAGTFKVEMKTSGGLVVQKPTREVSLKPQQKVTLRYSVEAGEESGLHLIDLSLKGADVALKRQYALEVEAATPTKQQTLRYTVEPGATLAIHDPAVAGYFPGTLSAHLFVSARPPIDVKSAARWLLQYPYGCVEQTTSSAYPWLFVDEASARRFGLKPYTRAERAERIDFALGKLSGYQAPSGSFALWGGESYDLWLTAYVSGFLQDARAQDFTVPNALYDKAMDYLLRALQEGSSQIAPLPKKELTPEDIRRLMSDYSRNKYNYAALVKASYILARERKAPLATLRLLADRRDFTESGLPLVELGIALHLMGDNARAQQLIEEGVRKERRHGYWWWDYGSDLRDVAMSYVLLKHNNIPVPAGSAHLLNRVQDILSVRESSYLSTQERLALFRLGQTLADEPDTPWKATIESAGTKRTVDSDNQFSDVSASEFARGLTLSNPATDHPLYVELALSGNPMRAPSPPSPNEAQIALTRDYLRADGSPLGKEVPRVGDVVLVHLHVRAERMATGTALVIDRIPAGLEIENANLAQGESGEGLHVKGINVNAAMQSSQIQHLEFRDDRFVAAVKLPWYGSGVDLFYRARVVTPGQYLVPPLYAEDMYRPYVYGILNPQTKMTITDGNESPTAE